MLHLKESSSECIENDACLHLRGNDFRSRAKKSKLVSKLILKLQNSQKSIFFTQIF